MKAIAPTSLLQSSLVDLLDLEVDGDLDGLPRHLWERALGDPARDFLRRPGKQFRSRLVYASWVSAGGAAHAMPSVLPQIVELLHAGSLIVDDIEDQAETRRDAPALHRVHGVPLALNTGNWMYFWALTLIERLPLESSIRADLTREACQAVERCHRGQALDLALKVSELSQGEIARVVRAASRLKTAALMELSAVIGAIALGAESAQVEALRRFGRDLGTGLQMLDDLGSITSPARAHKASEDLENDRPTWPWAWLASCCSASEYEQHIDRLKCVLRAEEAPEALAQALSERVAEAGRERVHSSLLLSLAELQAEFGDLDIIAEMRAEISRLEKSYE